MTIVTPSARSDDSGQCDTAPGPGSATPVLCDCRSSDTNIFATFMHGLEYFDDIDDNTFTSINSVLETGSISPPFRFKAGIKSAITFSLETIISLSEVFCYTPIENG